MKKLLYLGLCLVPFIFTGCVTLDVLSTVVSVGQEIVDVVEAAEKVETIAKSADISISDEDEYIIGRAVASSAFGTYSLYDNKAVTKYVNKICSVIVMNSSMPYLYKGYCVAILDTDEVNALSTPGGHILITRGLIECAETEDALAAVIAHEVAHIQLGHAMDSIEMNRGIDLYKQIAGLVKEENPKMSDKDMKIFNETRTTMFTTLFNTGFSKSAELDADKKAMSLMLDAGYNPMAMLDLLNILETHSTEQGWSKTHPSPEVRIKNAKGDRSIKKYTGAPASVRQPRFDKVKDRF